MSSVPTHGVTAATPIAPQFVEGVFQIYLNRTRNHATALALTLADLPGLTDRDVMWALRYCLMRRPVWWLQARLSDVLHTLANRIAPRVEP